MFVEHTDLSMSEIKQNMSNCQPLEVVCRGTETQLRVKKEGENIINLGWGWGIT